MQPAIFQLVFLLLGDGGSAKYEMPAGGMAEDIAMLSWIVYDASRIYPIEDYLKWTVTFWIKLYCSCDHVEKYTLAGSSKKWNEAIP